MSVCAVLSVYGTTHRMHVSMCWVVIQLQSEAWCGTLRFLTFSFQVLPLKTLANFQKFFFYTSCFMISMLSVSTLLLVSHLPGYVSSTEINPVHHRGSVLYLSTYLLSNHFNAFFFLHFFVSQRHDTVTILQCLIELHRATILMVGLRFSLGLLIGSVELY